MRSSLSPAPRSAAPGGAYGAAKRRVLDAHRDRSATGVARFVVRAGPIPEGHERLTREAAAGVAGITAADVAALIEGVRRPDTESLRNHILPGQQRRHALRATLCQPLAAALNDARNHLRTLHSRALAAPTRRERYLWIGEALHLVQDAYAPAHVERTRGTAGHHPISYIRFFGPTSAGYPTEHAFPFDPRDLVAELTGGLKPWSLTALDAGREYLWLMQRGGSGLDTFIDRHFTLSPQRREPSERYLRCRLTR